MTQKKTLPSLTCSAASEGSASASKQPDLFAQLPSASETSSAKPSCESIGPTSQSTTTSIHSTGRATATSSQEATRANRFPSPGSKKARQMTVTSGRQCLKLLSAQDPAGSWLKTLLVTSQWASTRCCLTWKAQATPRGRLLYRLAVSMPRTAATESSFWPTPNSSDFRDRGNLSMPSIQRRKRLGKQLNLSMVVSKESGALNPEWVEWLMGFPAGWTNLTSGELQPELKTEPSD